MACINNTAKSAGFNVIEMTDTNIKIETYSGICITYQGGLPKTEFGPKITVNTQAEFETELEVANYMDDIRVAKSLLQTIYINVNSQAIGLGLIKPAHWK